MYSDINNRYFVRVERDAVAVYQVLKGATTRLASWPAPGKTTGALRLDVQALGPQLSVTLDGRKVGSVEVDRALPPGLPWIDLGAPGDVSVQDVKVRRP
jgi:hypothetical protein